MEVTLNFAIARRGHKSEKVLSDGHLWAALLHSDVSIYSSLSLPEGVHIISTIAFTSLHLLALLIEFPVVVDVDFSGWSGHVAFLQNVVRTRHHLDLFPYLLTSHVGNRVPFLGRRSSVGRLLVQQVLQLVPDVGDNLV